MNVTPPANGPLGRDRRTATLVMACVGVFVAYLPVTGVAASLPAIQAALDASTSQLTWVQSAFILPMAALILTAGVVGSVHGRKRTYVAGMLFSAAGAAVALSAHSVQVLWAGQAVAGLGAATLLPTTLALINDVVPDVRERGRFIGLWATSLLVALAVAPLIAGVVLEHADWRWIYALPVPVALVAAALAVRLLPASAPVPGQRLDWPGQITATLAITTLVYGVIEGGAHSFTEPSVVAALCVAVVTGVAFVLVERRSTSPMLDLALFRSPAFVATTLVALIMFLALIGFFFLLSLYFGLVQQLPTLEAGQRMCVVTVAAIVAGQPVGLLMHRVPARVMITGGLLVVTAALLALTGLEADTSYAGVAWRLALLGVGMGAVVTPMTATAVASVPRPLAGMAAAGSNAFRQVGGALGPAVLGTLLTTRAVAALPGHLADAGVTGATREQVVAAADAGGLGAVAQLRLGAATGPVLGAVGDSFLDGLRTCLLVAAGLTLLAALVSALLLRPGGGTGGARPPAAGGGAGRPEGAERAGVGASGTPTGKGLAHTFEHVASSEA
ncbi:MFS transporter [Streptomyces sp. Z26]|uniref:MFS transporter n=1 Tax=Streptomyces TaxID=1883 RepID=UPI001F0BCE0F|nr:MFS transporter [Streptomyces sp. Z26]